MSGKTKPTNTFVVETRVELNHLGKGWEQAYLIFTPFTWNENKKLSEFKTKTQLLKTTTDEKLYVDLTNQMSDSIMELITTHLVDGKGWDGKALIEITKDNFGELPIKIISMVISELQGEVVNPKG